MSSSDERAPRSDKVIVFTEVQQTAAPFEVEMARRLDDGSYSELYMGFRIHVRDGIYIAHPLDWSQDGEEAIVASDLETVRQEIRRWWYQVGA